MTVTVIGYDGGPLPEAARQRLAAAELVAGGVRHLAHPEIPASAETVVMGELSGAVERIADHRGAVVVLASGDPGFFGVLRALRARGIRPEVHPARSSVAAAFARIAMPWDDAAVVSAHGRELRAAINTCRALPKVAVLTGPATGPARIAAELLGWERSLVVAERLGEKDERITRCTPDEAATAEWEQPNVVLVLDETRLSAGGPRWSNQVAVPPDGWGWSEERFVHRDHMVTKREVRALALGLLRPTLGSLIWDVGSGSGAVAVECAAMNAAVIAIEDDPEACLLIRRNAASFRVDLRVVPGHAPEVYAGLPEPDAVFVGGGGLPALEGALVYRPASVVAAYAAVDRIGSARWLLTAAGYEVEGFQIAASRFADLPGGSVRLAAQNPVFLIAGRRP